jgi:hypothetical protein
MNFVIKTQWSADCGSDGFLWSLLTKCRSA